MDHGIVGEILLPGGLVAGGDCVVHRLRSANELGLRDGGGILERNEKK
jgi:hypothetical protein